MNIQSDNFFLEELSIYKQPPDIKTNIQSSFRTWTGLSGINHDKENTYILFTLPHKIAQNNEILLLGSYMYSEIEVIFLSFNINKRNADKDIYFSFHQILSILWHAFFKRDECSLFWVRMYFFMVRVFYFQFKCPYGYLGAIN